MGQLNVPRQPGTERICSGVQIEMPRCSICLQKRRSLKFETGRISICSDCVRLLNATVLSPSDAEARWRAQFSNAIVRKRPDAVNWVERWLDDNGQWISRQQMGDPQRVKKSPELKVMRAYRRGLICLSKRHLDYPKNWLFKRYQTKHLDGYACNICRVREDDAVALHVHHIVFRSNSGTNSYRNLVTLCLRHHQEQHEHENSAEGGEPRGSDSEQTEDQRDETLVEPRAVALRHQMAELAYAEARPTFETALLAFRAAGKTPREFFAFLIQTFGRNVGPYALRFAEEEKSRNRWFSRK